MSYVDNKGDPDVTTIDARRARRMELARGWRFACICPRCQAEAPTAVAGEPQEASNDDVQVAGSGAQVEAAVSRFENGEIGPELRSKADADDIE